MRTSLFPLHGKDSPEGHFDIRAVAEPELESSSHMHDFLEVIFFTAGGGVHVIGQKTFAIRPGSIFFLSPYTVHRLRLNWGSQFFVITFDANFLRLPQKLDPLDLSSLDPHRIPLLAPFLLQEHLEFQLEPQAMSAVEDLCHHLYQERQHPGLCAQEVVRSYLAILLSRACQCHERAILGAVSAGVCRPHKLDVVHRTLKFIREGSHQKITLEEAARAVFLSPTHLAHVLKRETGKTFVDLVSEKRLERASELLLHTALSIGEVARQVGFEDAGYFAKCFRKALGVSPSLYRA